MRGRLHRRIEALRDRELPRREAESLERRLQGDAEAARVLRRTEALGRAVREAWREGPQGPDPELLLQRLRPSLARVDREIAERRWGGWMTGRLVPWIAGRRAPVLAAGTAAAALLLVLLLPPIFSTVPTAGEARAESATVVRSLRQQMDPVLVLEGGDGATIIWVLDEADPDLSRATPQPEGWA